MEYKDRNDIDWYIVIDFIEGMLEAAENLLAGEDDFTWFKNRLRHVIEEIEK